MVQVRAGQFAPRFKSTLFYFLPSHSECPQQKKSPKWRRRATSWPREAQTHDKSRLKQ